jgi:hypothetical protein
MQPDSYVVLLELEHIRQLLFYPRGFAPRTPLLAPSLAAFGRLASGREAHSLRSLAFTFAEAPAARTRD